jgi:glycogen synthase
MELPPMRKPSRSKRTIVFVTFETEFAPCGGLAAVMKIFPKQLAKTESCCTIGPYFENITTKKPISAQIANTGIEFALRFGDTSHVVRVLKHTDNSGYSSYLLQSDGLFTAPTDPYINPGNPEKLLYDSLFFCAAVPKALIALGKTSDLVLHLQDWESASVAHTVKNERAIESVACILTLHNPYDRGIDARDAALISAQELPGETILTKVIPLVDGSLSTVSRNFADELTNYPLHTQVFADHLQDQFKSKGIVGVDNGLFGKHQFPFSEDADHEAKQGDFGLIQKEKWERRIALSETIDKYMRDISGNPDTRVWGEGLDLSDPRLPVFLCLGRDDPRQKGYDVAAEAIRAIPVGKARYIFTPMPGDEGFEGLNFLKNLAEERPGEVMVFPFRLGPKPFMALQRGSSYMAMFSLYEPFGGANEAYLAGMPVVARATGGLVQQTIPHESSALSPYGRQLIKKYHGQGGKPTGFLFREPSLKNDVDGWQKIVDCAYLHGEQGVDRIEDRRGIPLYDEMVKRAGQSLEGAIELYSSDQDAYAEMIYSGFKMLDNFSWDRAIVEYRRLYDIVSTA